MLLRRAISERVDENRPPCIVVGLMSGTSLDGLDVAVVSLRGSGHSLEILDILAFETIPLPQEDVRGPIQDLLQCTTSEARPLEAAQPLQLVCRIHTAWSRFAAEAVRSVVQKVFGPNDTQTYFCIGSHGQTLWHEGHLPPPRSTLQLGDGETLAAHSGALVVSNFRSADVAAGGCGAPLVPYMDRILGENIAKWSSCHNHPSIDGPTPQTTNVVVVFQNLGGIGNVSCEVDDTVPPPPLLANPELAGEQQPSPPLVKRGLIAFDTGPANVILNELIEVAYRKYSTNAVFLSHVWSLLPSSSASSSSPPLCDWNSCFSSRGAVRQDWLDKWVESIRPFLNTPPPKSTGREVFGATFVHQHCSPLIGIVGVRNGAASPADNTAEEEEALYMYVQNFFDLCRTAVEFTAWTLAVSYRTYVPPFQPSMGRGRNAVVILSGGGASNPVMVRCIRDALRTTCCCASGGGGSVADGDLNSIRVSTLDAERKERRDSEREVDRVGGTKSPSGADVCWGDAKEAVAFAILAHEKLNEIAGVFAPWSTETGEVGTNVMSATGASRGVVLGQLSVPTV